MEQVLTIDQVFALLKKEAEKNGNNKVGGVIKGTAIVMRESGGNVKAFRPASKNPAGGNDRGIWQWNDKWNPEISDADAYDPVKATEWAYKKSGGFTHFKPWDGAKITKAQFDAAVEAARRYGIDIKDGWSVGAVIDVGTNVLDDLPIVGPAIDVVTGAADSILGWTEALGKLLSNLIDPSWWKRIGVGALGLVIVIAALVLVFRTSVVDAVNPLPSME